MLRWEDVLRRHIAATSQPASPRCCAPSWPGPTHALKPRAAELLRALHVPVSRATSDQSAVLRPAPPPAGPAVSKAALTLRVLLPNRHRRQEHLKAHPLFVHRHPTHNHYPNSISTANYDQAAALLASAGEHLPLCAAHACHQLHARPGVPPQPPCNACTCAARHGAAAAFLPQPR